MCLICAHIIKDKLTPKEIAKNYFETPMLQDHYKEFNDLLIQKGLEEAVAREIFEIYKKE